MTWNKDYSSFWFRDEFDDKILSKITNHGCLKCMYWYMYIYNQTSTLVNRSKKVSVLSDIIRLPKICLLGVIKSGTVLKCLYIVRLRQVRTKWMLSIFREILLDTNRQQWTVGYQLISQRTSSDVPKSGTSAPYIGYQLSTSIG